MLSLRQILSTGLKVIVADGEGRDDAPGSMLIDGTGEGRGEMDGPADGEGIGWAEAPSVPAPTKAIAVSIRPTNHLFMGFSYGFLLLVFTTVARASHTSKLSGS